MAKENEKPLTEEAEVPPTEPAVSETPNEDEFFSSLGELYPDDAGNREALFARAKERYDQQHEFYKKQTAENEELANIFAESPELFDMFMDVIKRGKNGNPELAFLKLPPALLDVITGKTTTEAYEAEKSRRSQAQEEESRLFSEVCKEEGLDEEETMKRIVETLLNPMATHQIGKEQFRALIHSLDYDEAIAAAETRGRNAKIVEEQKKSLRKSDGQPNIPGTSSGAPAKPQTMSSSIAKERGYWKDL